MPRRAWVWLTLLLIPVVPAHVSAEPFVDLFLGAAITQDADADLTFQGPGTTTLEDLKFDTSSTVGERVGHWFGPFGFNLEGAYFRPEPDKDAITKAISRQLVGVTLTCTDVSIKCSADLHVVGLGINGMLRGQFLKDKQIPEGRLQLYGFAGPTLFISTLDLDIKVKADSVGLTDDSDTDARVGMTAGVGVTYMFTKSVGAFVEYRFTHHSPKFEIDSVKIETTINTHHPLAGMTFRF